MTWLKRVLLLAVLVLVAHQLFQQWPDVSGTLASLPFPSVVLSFLSALAGILLGPLRWRIVLADLGTPARRTDAATI